MNQNPSSPVPAPVPPQDDENLLHEILLCLPPHRCSIPRASLVCKRWRKILSDKRFLHRFRKHHRKPPLLGLFYRNLSRVAKPIYTPIMNSPDRIIPNHFPMHTQWNLEFDLERRTLAVIEKPACAHVTCYRRHWCFQILRGGDNAIGLAVLSITELSLQLWVRKSYFDGVASWVLKKTIKLDELFSPPPPHLKRLVTIPGYDEDTNVIFLSSHSHNFMLQLDSMQFKCIGRRQYMTPRTYHPYTNVYFAVRGTAGGNGVAENVNT